jgi:hypothetical protein
MKFGINMMSSEAAPAYFLISSSQYLGEISFYVGNVLKRI